MDVKRTSSLRYSKAHGLELDLNPQPLAPGADDNFSDKVISILLPYKHTIALLYRVICNWDKPLHFLALILSVNVMMTLFFFVFVDWPILTLIAFLSLLYFILKRYSITDYILEFSEFYSKPVDDPVTSSQSSLYSLGVEGISSVKHETRTERSNSFGGPESPMRESTSLHPSKVEAARARASREWMVRKREKSSIYQLELMVSTFIDLVYTLKRLLPFPIGSSRSHLVQLSSLGVCVVIAIIGHAVSGKLITYVVVNVIMLLPRLVQRGGGIKNVMGKVGIDDNEELNLQPLTEILSSASSIAATVALETSELKMHVAYLESRVSMLEEEISKQAVQYEEEATELARVAREQLEQVAERHEEVIDVWRSKLNDCQQRLTRVTPPSSPSKTVSHDLDDESKRMFIGQLLNASDRVENCIDQVQSLPSERLGELEAQIADLPPCCDQVSVIGGIIAGEVHNDLHIQGINSSIRALMVPVGSLPGAVDWMIRASNEKRMRDHMRGLTPRKVEKKKIANRDFDDALSRLRSSLDEIKLMCGGVVEACHTALDVEMPQQPASVDEIEEEQDRGMIALAGRVGDVL